jgi:hypothetical protein
MPCNTFTPPVLIIPFPPFIILPISGPQNYGRQANPFQSTETISSNPPLLYPNPTNGKLTVNFNLDAKINGYNVSIYSVDGRNVLSNTINEKMEAASTLSKDFDISDQPNGVYFIRITSENNVLVNEKFILNK